MVDNYTVCGGSLMSVFQGFWGVLTLLSDPEGS